MRSVSVIPALLCAFLLAGCATDRLERSAPAGVNLTGEWSFNPNLSDNPDLPAGDSDKAAPQRTPGSRRGRGGGHGGGGGGMPPIGSPGSGGYNYLPVALTSQEPDASPPQPSPGAAPNQGPPRSRGPGGSRSLKAPSHLSITQKDSSVVIRANMPDGTEAMDEYTAGSSTEIPYGHDDTAKRSVGWRGPVFVVTTDAKKAGWHEDDFALDEDGRLIITTATKGGRSGNKELKRVYDRVRGAEADVR